MIKISSKDNSLVKHINKLNKSSKYRREKGEFTAEGVRLCKDAMESGAEILSLIICEDALKKHSEIITALENVSDNSYIFSKSVFKSISETKTSQGIICVIKTLDKPTLFDKIKSNGKFLALESLQDPSNLGTILRTAEAIGIDGVVLSGDCCDIYSPKVVRGSMGAVFRIPFIIVNTVEEFIISNKSTNFYASVVGDDADKINDTVFKEPCVLIVGNEGNGLKKSTIELCDKKITIPMNGRAESLNASAAAAILIWEMVK